MLKRLALLAASILLLLLAACGTPGTTPTNGTGGATPSSIPMPNTPTLPAGQRPPRPVPDPSAVAAGAPLRATLLAQIDEYAREVAKCQSIGTPVVSCNVTGYEAVRPNSPELVAYVNWYNLIMQCSTDGKGGYIFTMMFIYPSPDELRDPGLLDVYVSGTPWCGQTRPDASPSATPSTRPATPNATPTSPAGQRPPRPTPDPAAVAAGAPLRTTLLAQIDAAEQLCAATPTSPTSKCLISPSSASNGAELNAYAVWYSSISQCSSDGKGSYIFTLALLPSTPVQLRDPGLLDVYVANTPWCGLTGSATGISSSGSAGPTIPRPSTVPAVQGIIEIATAKSITSDGRPDVRVDEFRLGEEMYITYTALNVGSDDTVDLKMFRDGAIVALQDTSTSFDKAATYYGYYSYRPIQAGEYRIELYFNGQPVSIQPVTFTVR